MNTTIKTGLAAILLLAISCSKENITTSADSQFKYNSVTLADSFYIGQNYGGGIIFYIDSTRQHGLIADTADLSKATWGNWTDTVTGATKTKIGTGKGNTYKIILVQGRSVRYAALECGRNRSGGYRDWFLPSKDELNELYKQKDVIGGFRSGSYWSSSEYISSSAWDQTFNRFGGQYTSFKEPQNFVRAIRAF